MKIFTSFSVFCLMTLWANLAVGQTFHQYLGTTDSDNPSCIEKTVDGGYIISGENNIYVYI